MWFTYKYLWAICGINKRHKYAFTWSYVPTTQHTYTHLGIKCCEKIWYSSKEICQQESPWVCWLSTAGVRAIPAPTLFIRSLFTGVTISHRKYNDLYNFQPSAQAAHICVHRLGWGFQMFLCWHHSIPSLCRVLRVRLESRSWKFSP